MAKTTIRRGVFETNSSSTHSLSIASEEDFYAWINGKKMASIDLWDFEIKDFVSIKTAVETTRKWFEEEYGKLGIPKRFSDADFWRAGFASYEYYEEKAGSNWMYRDDFQEHHIIDGKPYVIFGIYGRDD